MDQVPLLYKMSIRQRQLWLARAGIVRSTPPVPMLTSFSNMSEIEACLRRLITGEIKQKQCQNERNCADFSDMSVLELMEKQIMIDMEEIG